MTSASPASAPEMHAVNAGLPAGAAVHLVGIGGAGMSGIARHLIARGHPVSGSDLVEGEAMRRLARAGARTFVGHGAANLPVGVACVVCTEAVADENPELVAARERGVEVVRYGAALAHLLQGRRSTAVAGTHGKTTTAAILAFILREAGFEPGALVGGDVPQLDGGVLLGEGEPMVVEACEYRESFLELAPRHAVITNVDDDHLDHYGTEDRLRAAFRRFARSVDPSGLLVTTSAAARELDLRGAASCRMLTLGPKRRDVRLRVERDGSFSLLHPDGRRTPRMQLALPGHHNLMNAAMAVVIADRAYGVDVDAIAAAVGRFGGVERRFDVLLESEAAVVVDDYAHHPAELEATLLTARRRHPGHRVVAMFQPHLASRTRRHFPGFLNALAHADVCLLVDDYVVAGRDEDGAAGARMLREALAALYMPCLRTSLADAADALIEIHRPGDVIVACGAGDVGEASRELAQRLR